jgi:hypothetical protein
MYRAQVKKTVVVVQNEEYNPRDQQVIELPDDKEKARIARDPVYRMQREQERDQARGFSVKEASEKVAALLEVQKFKGADGADHKWNRELKREMRGRRRETKALDERCVKLCKPYFTAVYAMSTEHV